MQRFNLLIVAFFLTFLINLSLSLWPATVASETGPTATYTPTPTSTPDIPARITVTPTDIPDADEYCGEVIEATYFLTSAGTISGSMTIVNTGPAWPANRVWARLWQYYNLSQSDTGQMFSLPAMDTGDSHTFNLTFNAGPYAGATWYQVKLFDSETGNWSPCTSHWDKLDQTAPPSSRPGPPMLVEPANGSLITDTCSFTLTWAEANTPSGGGPVEEYLVQLAGADLIVWELVASPTLTLPVTLLDNNLALTWQARARNDAGWGLWSDAHAFGVESDSAPTSTPTPTPTPTPALKNIYLPVITE